MSKEQFRAKKAWREHGAVLLIAHPDDEALFWGTLHVLLKEKIPVTVMLMTLGEQGSIHGMAKHETTAEKVKEIRQKEFTEAIASLGVQLQILSHPDFRLAFVPTEQLFLSVLHAVRAANPDVIFSFWEKEFTKHFNHVDHNLTGKIAEMVGEATDLPRYPDQNEYPNFANAMEHRPEYFAWTTDRRSASHKVKLTKKTRAERNAYLHTYYPSQFPEETKDEWVAKFDHITAKNPRKPHAKKHQEYLQQVR